MKKEIPNIITTARIVGSIVLLQVNVSTQVLVPFWGIYAFCGLTDIADGVVARRLKVETKTGALFDSIADIIFVVCAAYKLFPNLMFSLWMWIWIAIIIGIKVINIISALLVYGKPLFLHTLANKITGFMLFLCIPLWVCFDWYYSLTIVAALATFAAIQEGHFIRTRMDRRYIYHATKD